MDTSTGILYLSRSEIAGLGGDSPELYLAAVERAFRLHAEGRFVQPLKPYLRPAGSDGHIADRIIAMPAALLDERPIAGLKWIGSKHDNPALRSIERASGLIILNDATTHYPIAVLEAGLISAMRTAAVTAIGVRHLARPDARFLTCIGCGLIGRMQVLTLLAVHPELVTLTLFDSLPSAAERLACEIRERFPQVDCTVAPSAADAVRAGEIVVTCTVADRPYISADWLQAGTFVSNVSIMDLTPEAFLLANKVVVDDWEQSNRQKKMLNQLVESGRFSRAQLHAELGEIVVGRKVGRETRDEIIVLNPMGLAIEDIACAQAIYEQALVRGIGTRFPLF